VQDQQIKLWGDTVVRTFKVPISEFPDFEGTVRPMTPGEAAQFRRRIGEGASKPNWDEIKETAKVYAEHIKTWNVDAEITPEAIAQLPLPVHNQLWGIVMGHAPGDEVKKS
jgi:hypothetical protein